jgi:hypothetical protein
MQKNERSLRLVGRTDRGEPTFAPQTPPGARLRRFLGGLLAPPLERAPLYQADFGEAAAPVRTVIPAYDIYLA